MFALTTGNLTGEQMAIVFVANRLKMGRFLKNHPATFIARVSSTGVVLVFPTKPKP